MSFRPARRLPCFYCNSRAAHQWNGTSKSFQCRRCEATNYLDQNGGIIDPPAQSTPTTSRPTRFARPARSPPRSAQPSFGRPEPPAASGRVFCDECLRNQHFAREILANHLPDEHAPHYQQCLENLDTFTQELYQRYPQVCARCAPRAREQLRKSAKVARSDHLQRLIDRTKMYGPWNKNSGSLWKSLLIRIGGISWWTSVMLSICWHAIIAATNDRIESAVDDMPLEGRGTSGSVKSCAQHVYQEGELHPSCVPNVAQWMPMAIMIAMLTIWWHPRMRAMQESPGGRCAGLLRFYTLQLISVGVRWLAWNKLGIGESQIGAVQSDNWRALHAFIAVGLVLTTLMSHKAVRIEQRPPINFTLSPKHLLSDIASSDDTRNTPQAKLDYLQQRPPPSFPIANLGATNRLPTPPPEEDYHCPPPPCPGMGYANAQPYQDPDAMDWSPSGPSAGTYFNPQHRPGAQAPPPSQMSPSPFHGTLPAAPLAPSHRMRNPNAYNPSVFRKATEAQKDNMFRQRQAGPQGPAQGSRGRPRKENPLDYSLDDDESDECSIATGLDEREEATPYTSRQTRSMKKRNFNMQQPSFWPQQDNAETGLEDLFSGGSFRLEERASPAQGEGNRWGRLFGYGR